MGYFTDSARAFVATVKNALRKPVTYEYPKVLRPRAERFRAAFALVHDADGDEACIGCLACERICPSHVVSVKQAPKRESPVTKKKRGYAEDFTIDATACMACELCVQVCPTDALVMTKTPEEPGFAREDLVFTMAKLYENEKSREKAWSNGTRLMEMQEPPKPAKPAAAAKAAPAAAPANAEAKAAPATNGETKAAAPAANGEAAPAAKVEPKPEAPAPVAAEALATAAKAAAKEVA